jgi:hypothetical protein
MDSSYAKPAALYCAVLFVACVIAEIVIGPGTLAVWLLTVATLIAVGKLFFSGKDPPTRPPHFPGSKKGKP